MIWALLGLHALALGGSGAAVVVENRVPQYQQAARAAEQHLPGVVEVDPGAADLEEKLSQAAVVLAVGRKALSMAREHALGKPVVFCMVLGVSEGDLAQNVTGVPLESDPRAVLQRIQAVLPHAKRVGFIYQSRESALLLAKANQAAGALGISLVARPVTGGGGGRDAFEAIAGSVDALWLPPDPKLFSGELAGYLLSSASERRLPLFGFLQSFTEAGALASVSPNYADDGDRAGKLASEILARSAAARLPVPPLEYAPGDFSLNLNTAHALGIVVPAAAIASAGSHVIR